MNKDVVQAYGGILLSHKKEWNTAIHSNMDGRRNIILSEAHQKEKDKYITYMWILTYETNGLVYETDSWT